LEEARLALTSGTYKHITDVVKTMEPEIQTVTQFVLYNKV